MKGMILAAGFGTRLLPLTRLVPKALLPVAEDPVLGWNLRWMAAQGATEVAINAHHLAGRIEAWLHDETAAPSCPTRLFVEEEILGTAGGIANAAGWLDSDPVVIANADQLFRPDLTAAREQHKRRGDLATLFLARDPRFAQVRVDGERVIGIAPSPLFGVEDLWCFTGVYLLAREAVERVRAAATIDGWVRFAEIVPHLRAWIAEGRVGAIADPHAPFLEVGTPESYLELLLRGSLPPATRTIEPGCWIDPSVPLPAGLTIEESIVLAGARIEPGATIRRSILGPGAEIRGTVERTLCAGGETLPIGLLSSSEEHDLAAFLGGALKEPALRSLCLLQGDGSTRRFLRAVRSPAATRARGNPASPDDTPGAADSVILMLPAPPSAAASSIYPSRAAAPGESETFAYVAGHLERLGIRVPRIVAHEARTGRLVLEDLGRTHLFDLWLRARRSGDSTALAVARAAYEEAVDLLARLQAPADPPFDPARTGNLDYDEEFILRFEADYFLREMVRGHAGLDLDPAEAAAFDADSRKVAKAALAGTAPVLMHRDYQSRNLMVTAGGLAVIDFQGARPGPPEYDLASLLEDPYADLPEEWKEALRARYRAAREAGARERHDGRVSSGTDAQPPPATIGSAIPLTRQYQACAINRLMQALGAYGYLGGRLGKPGFLEHAPVAARRLGELAEGVFPGIARLAGNVLTRLE